MYPQNRLHEAIVTVSWVHALEMQSWQGASRNLLGLLEKVAPWQESSKGWLGGDLFLLAPGDLGHCSASKGDLLAADHKRTRTCAYLWRPRRCLL